MSQPDNAGCSISKDLNGGDRGSSGLFECDEQLNALRIVDSPTQHETSSQTQSPGGDIDVGDIEIWSPAFENSSTALIQNRIGDIFEEPKENLHLERSISCEEHLKINQMYLNACLKPEDARGLLRPLSPNRFLRTAASQGDERAPNRLQINKNMWCVKSIFVHTTTRFIVASPGASKISYAALHPGLYRKDRVKSLTKSEVETILIGNGSADIAKVFIQTVRNSSIVKRCLLNFTNLPSNTEKRIVQWKFEILLISICDEINVEVTVDSERHFAVGGLLARGDLAIQGRSGTIVETINRASDIHTERFFSSSSRLFSLKTRLLTCEVKQEKSFGASEYWYRKSRGAQVLGATLSAFIDARLACIGNDTGVDGGGESSRNSNSCVAKAGKQSVPPISDNCGCDRENCCEHIVTPGILLTQQRFKLLLVHRDSQSKNYRISCFPGNYDMSTTYSGDFLAILTLCLLRGGPSAEAQSVGTTSPPSDADYILPEGPSTPEMTSESDISKR
jgi:hypothetical protein